MKSKKWIHVLLVVCVASCVAVLAVCGAMRYIKHAADDRLQPDTWEEYVKLSPEEKDAFFEKFDSVESFEEWMESVKPQETDPDIKWNKPGKDPDAYTWEEYQALSQVEQEAFFLWFGTVSAFEVWMESAKPVESTAPDLSWTENSKKPDAFTWEEYEKLTPEEQELFFLWFDSESAFEAWMETVKPTESAPSLEWDKPGKTPDAYTWEEYQALSLQEQDAEVGEIQEQSAELNADSETEE
jgi:hypothetical protein